MTKYGIANTTQKEDIDNAKLCPRCGAKPVFKEKKNPAGCLFEKRFYIVCHKCGLKDGTTTPFKGNAIKRWNNLMT